jgi:hypothetical protein
MFRSPFYLFLLLHEGFWSVGSLIFAAFTIWMLVECLRKDPERNLWWWIILFIAPIGPIIYFFVRWLPESRIGPPRWLHGLTRGREVRRLQAAATQIGNPYHHVQLGDALRETGQFERARASYDRALAKEPDNIAALWGAAQVDLQLGAVDSACQRFARVLELDPQYKFGDASLAYAQALVAMNRTSEATAYLEKHVKRWRQPEGVYLLAQLNSKSGQIEEARRHLELMLLEIEASPLPIARKQGTWRRRGQQLLRKLG